MFLRSASATTSRYARVTSREMLCRADRRACGPEYFVATKCVVGKDTRGVFPLGAIKAHFSGVTSGFPSAGSGQRAELAPGLGLHSTAEDYTNLLPCPLILDLQSNALPNNVSARL